MTIGTSGLILNEPLLWERGRKGRTGMSLPKSDVPSADLPAGLLGDGPNFPDLSEVEIARHYTRLSTWNFGVDTGLYPLGSCTMKYNPKINEKIAATPALANAHPLLDDEQVQGALQLMYELQEYLAVITGLPAVSLQPAAGAHGEMTGMLIFSAYHRHRQSVRTKIIIPDTAHGTNPASAALCGFKPVPLASGPDGIIRVEDVAAVMDEECAGIMVTNPNTLGLFESNIREITEIVHAKGGLVYGDGANMNAVMGIMNAAKCGVDVLHLNLHKTFSTPHGGGGPGAGPICVTEDLRPFLPVPRIVKHGDGYERDYNQPLTVGRVHGFHGNYSVLIKAYSYIRTMGGSDLKRASQLAVLNANYLKEHIRKILKLAYDRPCMHECVFSDALQQENKIATIDIAKRLIDYGYHPPTIYFPLVVHGAIMIEPTETETKESLDEFVAALKAIVTECKENPQVLHDAPTKTKVRRLDETAAARKPFLCG